MKRIATLLAALLAPGAALADHRDIKVTDRGVFIPSVRLGTDIHPRGESPAVPHTGHAFEFGATGASGDAGQGRSVGSPSLVFGGQTFAAPVELRHDFDFRFYEAAYRYRHFFGGGQFGIEALGGLGYAEYELTTSSAAQRASQKLSSGGLVGGFGIVWKFLPQTSLQSRLTLFGSGENEGVTGAARWDLFVAQAIARNVGLRLGLTSWSVVSTREDDDDFKAPIREQYETQGSPYYATARLWDDGVIDPADTRRVLGMGLAAAAHAPIPEPSYGIFRM
jgi:hypothetical protein